MSGGDGLPNSLKQARKMMAGLQIPKSRYPNDITEATVAMATAWALLDIAESLRALRPAEKLGPVEVPREAS